MTSLIECIVLLKHYVRMSLGASDVKPRVILVFPTKPNADFFQKFVGEDQAQAACFIAGGGYGGSYRMAGLDVTITDEQTVDQLRAKPSPPLPASPAALFEDEYRILVRLRELETLAFAVRNRAHASENDIAALERRVLQIEQGADYRASVGRS